MTRLRSECTAALVVAAALLSACGRPAPATPTKAEATRDVLICWRAPADGPDPEEVGAAPEAVALRRAIEKRLQSAGYTLGAKKCDLRVRWHDSWTERGGDKGYSEATLTLFTPKGEIVDVFRYELDRDHFPIDEPDRLAIMFVNSINASPKVVQYATVRRSKTLAPASAEAPAAAPATPAP